MSIIISFLFFHLLMYIYVCVCEGVFDLTLTYAHFAFKYFVEIPVLFYSINFNVCM